MTADREGEVLDRIWINAMKCVVVTDEFAATVGREVIRKLMRDGVPKSEPLDPYRRLRIEVICS